MKAFLNVCVGEVFNNVNEILEWYEIENEPVEVALQFFSRTSDMLFYQIVAGGQATHLVSFSYKEDPLDFVPVYTVQQVFAYDTGVDKVGDYSPF